MALPDGDRVAAGPAFARGAPVTLRFDGRRVLAFEGESVGAALHASGERVLMRSIKYHRPRGLFCCTGKCANCLVRVDGNPNVRACVEPVRDGMIVETQNAFPNARRDFFSIVDKVYRKNFDYHEKFIRPRIFTPLYNGVIRRMAGFGKIPEFKLAAPPRPGIHKRDVDVLVVGAGPAGLAAAATAAEGAASVMCVEETQRAGGSLLLHRNALDGRDGVDVTASLLDRIDESGGETLTRATALGVYLTDGTGGALAPPGVVPILTPERILEVRARALVVATGYHETPALFPGNDLPGVMGARAALILLHRHGVLAGRRVVVASPDGLGLRAAEDLAKAGADIVMVLGEGPWKGGRIVEARGGATLDSVTLDLHGERRDEPVDLILCAGDETPRVELLQQAGVPLVAKGAALHPKLDAVPGVFAAGEVMGASSPAAALASGARAGEAAARFARGRGA